MAEIDLSVLLRKPIYLAASGYEVTFEPIVIDDTYHVVLGVRQADGTLDFMPSAELVQKIQDVIFDDTGIPPLPFFPVITDEDGRVMLGARVADGALDFLPSTELIRKLAAASHFGPEGVTGTFDDLTFFYPGWRAGDRISLFHALDEEGAERRYLLRTDIAQTVAVEATAGPIEMLVDTGESISAGGGDPSPINLNTAPETHRCLMFSGATNGGTMNIQSSAFEPGGVVGFEPAKETTAYGKGETQMTAMAAWLDEQIVENGRPRKTFLVRSHAQRGATIEQISATTVPYTNGLAEIERGDELSDTVYRRDLVVRSISVSTGVNDRSDGTTRTEMRDALVALCNSYNDDVPPLTDQDAETTIPLLVSQVRAPVTGTCSPDMALGQLDAVELDPRILLVGPEYFYQGLYGPMDSVHGTAKENDVRGEYKAKLRYDLFHAASPIAYTDWKGLRPDSISVVNSGTTIRITFHVPVPPLVLDTTTLPNFGNYGFRYTDDQGATISSVALYGSTGVDITMSGSIAANTNRIIGYADAESASNQTDRSKVWGNLRDSEPRESRIITGLKLYNWCATFRKAV
jgi:hypothetical protein